MDFAVDLVSPGFRAQVGHAAGELAPFGTQIVGLHLKFLNRILSRNDEWQVDVSDVQRLAV